MATEFALIPENEVFLKADGTLASGYQLFIYTAGSSTKATTHKESDGVTANTNPIVLDSLGQTPWGVYVATGTYKTVLASDTDTDPPATAIRTRDNITPRNDTTTAQSEWVASGLTPIYVGNTQFTFAGDQTSIFHAGRRLKTVDSGGTDYFTIVSSAYTTLTTITVDAADLDSGLSAVSYGLLSSTNSSIPNAKTIENLPRTNFHSSTYDSATWDEIQAEGGDYHAFPVIAQQPAGRILAVWMHQTQHSGIGADEDVVCKYSDDGGASWSSLAIIYGTLNGTDTIDPFYVTAGVDRYGRFVVIFDQVPSVAAPYITRSWDGVAWSTPVLLTYTGDAYEATNTLVPFNKIHLLPSGKLLLNFYQSDTVLSTYNTYAGVIDEATSETSVELRLITSRPNIAADSDISFTSPDKVNDASSRFANFEVGDRFITSGSASNDRTNTITAVAAGQLTVAEVTSTEGTSSVTIAHSPTETAIVPITEKIWLAFIRTGGVTGRVTYYSTVDSGTTWTYRGNVQENTSEIGGGWIVQQGSVVTIDDVRHVLLAIGLRDSATDPTHPTTTSYYTISSVQYFICPVSKAIDNSGVWRRLHEVAYTDDAFERDVYTSHLVDDVTGEIFAIAHEETATDESRITTARWNYREQAAKIQSWDITLEGTGGTANTYTGTPILYTIKRGSKVDFYGAIVLSAVNTTGPLTLTGLPYKCIETFGYTAVRGYTQTASADVGLQTQTGAKTMVLVENDAGSNLDSSEVAATFNLRFSGTYFTND